MLLLQLLTLLGVPATTAYECCLDDLIVHVQPPDDRGP